MSSENPITPIEYRLVIGFPLYRVGNDGSIWSRIASEGKSKRVGDRWRRLKGYLNRDGYQFVTLYTHLGSKVHTKRVSRLVLEAFVGPCPPGMQACHDPDPNRRNNNVANLRWDTPIANMEDAVRHGRILRGSAQPQSKLTEDDIPVIRRLAAEGFSRPEIARRFGICTNTAGRIINREKWKHVP